MIIGFDSAKGQWTFGEDVLSGTAVEFGAQSIAEISLYYGIPVAVLEKAQAWEAKHECEAKPKKRRKHKHEGA